MEKEKVCVFCGRKLSMFRNTTIPCGPTWQPACRDCEREVKELSELEQCRRALVRGLAEEPEKLRARIELIEEAENHRPKCVQCGGKMTFMEPQALDNSPMRDSIFHEPFEVLPAYCLSCGKYEFYNPVIVKKNKHLAHLIWKDTQE